MDFALDEGSPPAPAAEASWAARLVGSSHPAPLAREGARVVTALALAAIYGAALGARGGGASILAHAAGAPAALAAVASLGVPALYIGLAFFGAPVGPHTAVSITSRAIATTGLVLAGLAPAAALLVVTVESPGVAAATSCAGLAVAGAIGLVSFVRGLHDEIRTSDSATRTISTLIVAAFCLFAVLLASRVWWSALPILGGQS